MQKEINKTNVHRNLTVLINEACNAANRVSSGKSQCSFKSRFWKTFLLAVVLGFRVLKADIPCFRWFQHA